MHDEPSPRTYTMAEVAMMGALPLGKTFADFFPPKNATKTVNLCTKMVLGPNIYRGIGARGLARHWSFDDACVYAVLLEFIKLETPPRELKELVGTVRTALAATKQRPDVFILRVPGGRTGMICSSAEVRELQTPYASQVVSVSDAVQRMKCASEALDASK